MRTRGLTLGVALVALLVTGCSASGGSGGAATDAERWDAALAEDADAVEQVYTAVVPQVMAASGTTDFGTAGLVYALCGDRGGFDLEKTGVGVEINANLGAAVSEPARAAALLRDGLADDGWEVTQEGSPTTVEADRDDVAVRVVIGSAATQVDVVAACRETSVDYARAATGGAPEELEDPTG